MKGYCYSDFITLQCVNRSLSPIINKIKCMNVGIIITHCVLFVTNLNMKVLTSSVMDREGMGRSCSFRESRTSLCHRFGNLSPHLTSLMLPLLAFLAERAPYVIDFLSLTIGKIILFQEFLHRKFICCTLLISLDTLYY